MDVSSDNQGHHQLAKQDCAKGQRRGLSDKELERLKGLGADDSAVRLACELWDSDPPPSPCQ